MNKNQKLYSSSPFFAIFPVHILRHLGRREGVLKMMMVDKGGGGPEKDIKRH